MSMNTDITLPMKLFSPSIPHVTWVLSPRSSRSKVAVLCDSQGSMKCRSVRTALFSSTIAICW